MVGEEVVVEVVGTKGNKTYSAKKGALASRMLDLAMRGPGETRTGWLSG